MGTKIRKCNFEQLVGFIESKDVAVLEFQHGGLKAGQQVDISALRFAVRQYL